MGRGAGNWIRDILYSIFNIWGQGELVNDILNQLMKAAPSQGGQYEPTLNSVELINEIRKVVGNDTTKLTETLNKIDSAISKLDSLGANLPQGLSQNMRNILRGTRAEITTKRNSLLRDRTTVARNLSKVESTMNQGLSQAASQDYLTPSRKEANQRSVRELLSSKPTTDYESIERRLSDV